MDVSTPREHREALGMSSDQAADIARDRAQAKVNRLKKPLRELLERIMQELRKKDEVSVRRVTISRVLTKCSSVWSLHGTRYDVIVPYGSHSADQSN